MRKMWKVADRGGARVEAGAGSESGKARLPLLVEPTRPFSQEYCPVSPSSSNLIVSVDYRISYLIKKLYIIKRKGKARILGWLFI